MTISLKFFLPLNNVKTLIFILEKFREKVNKKRKIPAILMERIAG